MARYSQQELEEMTQAEIARARRQYSWGNEGNAPAMGSLKKGGKIKKTGLYKLHKGERVLRAKTKLSSLRGK